MECGQKPIDHWTYTFQLLLRNFFRHVAAIISRCLLLTALPEHAGTSQARGRTGVVEQMFGGEI